MGRFQLILAAASWPGAVGEAKAAEINQKTHTMAPEDGVGHTFTLDASTNAERLYPEAAITTKTWLQAAVRVSLRVGGTAGDVKVEATRADASVVTLAILQPTASAPAFLVLTGLPGKSHATASQKVRSLKFTAVSGGTYDITVVAGMED